MTKFKSGESGNLKGRPKGSLNCRTQLIKLIEPHAEQLAAKLIELALSGDISALRLCIERLIPKPTKETMEVNLPNEINEENLSEIKRFLLYEALNGRINAIEAERLIELISSHCIKSPRSLSISTKDPIEAEKIYRELMQGKCP